MAERNSDFNGGWLFAKGDFPDAGRLSFDDGEWESVALPHGLEILPENASGGRNYQGAAWYRKRFTLSEDMEQGQWFLRFEAVMGKSRIWINGTPVCEHFGGYLPIHLNITDFLVPGENLVALMADNSNSTEYPPGKEQELLDFCYFGGIYRDVKLIRTSETYISDANDKRWEEGGGIHFRCVLASEARAEALCRVHWHNHSEKPFSGIMALSLTAPQGRAVFTRNLKIQAAPGEARWEELHIEIDRPALWSPESPRLYDVEVSLLSHDELIDGTSFKTGLRTITLNGKKGMILNGKPYGDKLFGINRHQDYPHLGNAAGQLLHRRDAVKIKKGGLNFIRSAHYPQDPAFMDACDSLGLLIIVATPGWQFFRNDSLFRDRVYSDIRQMVRRDRNRPSVIIWEPILNETRYTEEFAVRAEAVTKEEDPDRFTTADSHTPGIGKFDIVYSHRIPEDEERPVLTREWGDSPDNWYDQTCRHRLTYSQGEHAMLTQVRRFLDPEPEYTWASLHSIPNQPAQYLGGALWAGIDCQRGYHPDPFYGGILDLYRREKYSWFLFRSQKGPDEEYAPMVFIANEFSPASPEDVMVFTNCDEVIFEIDGIETARRKPDVYAGRIKHPPVLFSEAFKWNRTLETSHLPEYRAVGLINGKKVAEHVRRRPGRKRGIQLRVDLEGMEPVNNGSDIIPLFAEIVDRNGTRVPHGDEWIAFEIEGDASIVGGEGGLFRNPAKASFGSAPLLVRTGTTAGEITVKARPFFEGTFALEPASVTIVIADALDPGSGNKGPVITRSVRLGKANSDSLKNKWDPLLMGVGEQQEEFIDTDDDKRNQEAHSRRSSE